MKGLLVAVAMLACAVSVLAQPSVSQQATSPSCSPVTWEHLLNAADEPENWLMYSGTLDSQRFSRLDKSHNENVDKLELKWAYQIPQLNRAETTPLVVKDQVVTGIAGGEFGIRGFLDSYNASTGEQK